jgi:hypothetical protein
VRERERETKREGACGGGVDLGLEALSSDAHSVFLLTDCFVAFASLLECFVFLTNLLHYYCVMAGVELQTSSL